MSTRLLILAFSLLIGGAAAAAPAGREAELARSLAGRVAGDPVQCIDLARVRSSRIVTDTAILWDAGTILYVNRPRAGAQSLDRDDILVIRTNVAQLCSSDSVQLFDNAAHVPRGLVFLGEFVPWRRAAGGHH